METRTCCFTGHRKLPSNKLDLINKNLSKEIDTLISKGVTNFISGGALGFDQLAAWQIIKKKLQGENIKLIFALPCHNQDISWTTEQKFEFALKLANADEILYISENYYDGCMQKRNAYMVENSDYCICALLNNASGTAQTVRMAKRKGISVINVV